MLTAIRKNQKGLTLIELLAVLVIVGIIAAIAIPAIGGTISKAETKADTASLELVESAALRYLIDNEDATTAITSPITITTLVSSGYLNETPGFNRITVTGLSFVKETNGTYTFGVVPASAG